jgi:hypothetical protein
MEGSRGRRSMLKLAAVCFSVAVALCFVWSSWACSGSGCRSVQRTAAAMLRSGNESSAPWSTPLVFAAFWRLFLLTRNESIDCVALSPVSAPFSCLPWFILLCCLRYACSSFHAAGFGKFSFQGPAIGSSLFFEQNRREIVPLSIN